MAEKRVSLSKKQLATEAGAGLLQLLRRITADGQVDDAEVRDLQAWLQEHESADDIPAVAWLRELVTVVLADGKVTPEERAELVIAIERVLPMEDRRAAKSRRAEAEPATERQIDYLHALNAGDLSENITKRQASDLIDKLKEIGGNVSPRQMMVLRFWDRLELAEMGKRAVSDWMDAWYSDFPNAKKAWEEWKRENPELQRPDADPQLVPIGAYKAFLRKKSWGRLLSNVFSGSKSKSGKSQPGCLGAIVWFVIAYGIWHWLRSRSGHTQ